MDFSNIKRNELDYILTDILPTELSDRFTYIFFYDFLLNKKKELKEILQNEIEIKYQNRLTFCESKNWATIPLKYSIMKQMDTTRQISLLHPLASLQLFVFIGVYEKELLNILSKNSEFSLRYHKRNNDLIYKSKNQSVIKYFSDLQNNTGRELIEQTGMFFNIGPYQSIAQFTSSEKWMVLNSKYRSFIKTDFKSCFDSIYTHTFSWIIGKDVNDTKDFRNGSVYTAIDRTLMNINGRTSNGIVVGPEYSRMVAEILLQTIDMHVIDRLLNEGYKPGDNYEVFRYVDDLFIFAKSEQLADKILSFYSESAGKFLLQLNEAKLFRSRVPFVLEEWLNDTNSFTNRASSYLFYTKLEQEEILDKYMKEHSQDSTTSNDDNNQVKPYLVKTSTFWSWNNTPAKNTIMNHFNELICRYPDKDKTIVAYFLGMILNKISRNKDKVRIFKKGVKEKTVFSFLDLVFYAYSFFPNFGNTQKLLAIASYVRDEYDIFGHKDELQELISKYAFVFDKGNLNDTVNLLLFCRQAGVEIPYQQENHIINILEQKDDPILWGTYLLYSGYSKKYEAEILERISKLLSEKIDAIVNVDSAYLYREFWWILIFNKCPFISSNDQRRIDALINSLTSKGKDKSGEIIGDLFIEYLKTSQDQFFIWDMNKDFLRNLTFKTRQRTIFKNYQNGLLSLYWSSL